MNFSDKALAAAADAMACADRIQGFAYGSEYVIRDVTRFRDAQVIWRGPLDDRAALDRQIEIERLRIAFQAAAAVMAETPSAEVLAPFKHGGGCLCDAGHEATYEAVGCPRSVSVPSLSGRE